MRTTSWDATKASKDPDSRLVSYPPSIKTYQPLRSEEEARNKFFGFKNGFFGKFLMGLRKEEVNGFVAGSSVLAATCSKANYEPADLDMYLKEIDCDQLAKIEKVVNELKEEKHRVIVVRRPITIAWWYLDENDNVVNQVQVNAMKIKHWISIFEDYHGNPVCIGYEVLSDTFRYHQTRWEYFITNPGINWFSNIYSCDIMFTLVHATKKYQQRGFNAKALIRPSNADEPYVVGKVSTFLDLERENDKAVDRLLTFNWGRNVVISKSVEECFFDAEPVAPIENLFHIYESNADYYFRPKKLSLDKSHEEDDKKKEFLHVKIDRCGHTILLEDLLGNNHHHRYPVCPRCRYRFIKCRLLCHT